MPQLKIWLPIAFLEPDSMRSNIMKSNYFNANSLTMYLRFLKFDILSAKTIMWRFNCNYQKFSTYHCQDISVDPDIACQRMASIGCSRCHSLSHGSPWARSRYCHSAPGLSPSCRTPCLRDWGIRWQTRGGRCCSDSLLSVCSHSHPGSCISCCQRWHSEGHPRPGRNQEL